ncbi:LysR family transcriptional regulator [Aquamicrobium zhengzhouense]|uniref:LysR family transcriptional regulator n=1 Tax=Aquamicrobium zhengzhouense TaxID=2781738 RepID=A0ABS0S9A6_9HYPH|nr:LysR family transcriptional regulator [Aquamicrobium zhengzhouense]MBI1619878.1 LysR family transcriptional regulator [Aquamicrobium zhengzhouense]
MTLDIRSATILIECARHGSLGRAAVALNMTQPALTRTLKVLEAGFGVSLFDRTTRGVVPTVYGEALLPYARLVVSEVANAKDLILQMQGASRGVVRVGGVASVVPSFIVSAIAKMRQSHPEVRFQIVEEMEDLLLEELKSGVIDIAVSPDPYVDDEITLATPDILRDVVHVYARPSHPLASREHVSLEEVGNADWILPPMGTPIAKEWYQRFHDKGIEPRIPALASRSIGVIRAAALSQDLLCWLPAPRLSDQPSSEGLVRIAAPDMQWKRSFRIYRRRRGIVPPPAKILVQAIRELALPSDEA